MIDRLKKIISKIDADYSDIRYENMLVTKINYNGRELGTIGANETDGYVLRVLKNGGFSSVAITKEEDIDAGIQKAVEAANIMGREIAEKISLTFPDSVNEVVSLKLNEDPRKISIDEKLQVLSHYNDLVMDVKNIQTTTMTYFDVYRDKYFVNSIGTQINEPLLTTGISGHIIGKKDGVIQNGRVSVGGSHGFESIRNRDELFIDKTKIVCDLLDAQPAAGGTYNVILDPDMAGVFVHEAFGHFSEADLIENNPTLREKMKIGSNLGSNILNIFDNPTIGGQLGYYKYDDEGVEARPVGLMKNGVLTGRLHSMRTAAKFKEPLTGHTVAEDYSYAPIIRMGCIYVEPGKNEFEDLLLEAQTGIYVIGCKGGQTSGENFTFGAQYAYLVNDGKLGRLVRDINIIGNLFSTLKNVQALSKAFKLTESGGCGKGQMNIRSCYGGPHVLIKNTLVGGV